MMKVIETCAVTSGLVLALMMCFLPLHLAAQSFGDMVAPSTPQIDAVDPISPLAQVSARLAYNSERGALVGASVQTDRLFGDHSLRIAAQVAEETERYNLAYAAPGLFGENPRLGVRVVGAQSNAGDVFAFNSQTFGIEPRLTWTLAGGATLAGYAGLSWSNIDGVASAASTLILDDVGDRSRRAIGLNFGRNHGFSDGILRRVTHGVTVEAGQTDRDHAFTQIAAHIGARWALGVEDRIMLRAQLRGASINTTNGTSHIGDRFMLGRSAIRGFAFGGFGPRDLEVAGDPALGGNHYAMARFDMQFAGFDDMEHVLPGLFLDVGSLWGLDRTAGGAAGADLVNDDALLRASVGVSVDFLTSGGPIKLSYAYPFERETYDRVQEFGISLERRF